MKFIFIIYTKQFMPYLMRRLQNKLRFLPSYGRIFYRRREFNLTNLKKYEAITIRRN